MPLKPIKGAAPYYDDWNENKNFLQILFRPGYAVQARELNQLQTILQNQIGSFADKIFENGTPIFGAKIDVNFEYEYIDADPQTYEVQYPGNQGFQSWVAPNLSLAKGLEVYTYDANNNKVVYGTVEDIATDKIFVKYYAGRANVGDWIYFDIVDAQNNTTTTYRFKAANIGRGISANVSGGIFYANRRFIVVPEQKNVIVDPNANNGNYVIGFEVDQKDIITEQDDPSLYENAQGTPNYAAPGAHRLTQTLILRGYDKTTFETNRPANFFAQVWIDNGKIVLNKNSVQYSDLLDLLAHRTYDESGNYTVEDFKISVKDDPTNANQLIAEVGEGKAYVYGYEVENIVPVDIPFQKANDANHIQTSNTTSHYINYGIYIDIATDAQGNPEISDIFDANKMEDVYLCDTGITTANVGTINQNNLIKDAAGNPVVLKVIAVGRNQFGEVRVWLGDWQGKIDYLSSAKSIVSATLGAGTALTINKWANLENYNGKIKIGRGTNETFLLPIANNNVRVKNIINGSVIFDSTKTFRNVVVTANSATISTAAPEQFSPDSVLLVVDATTGNPISNTSYTVATTPTSITITFTAGTYTNIHVLVKDQQVGNGVIPRSKVLSTQTDTITTDANGTAILTQEDVVNIISITDTANNQQIPVASVRLDNGQRDYYYDVGRIYGLAPNTQYSIQYQYYTHSGTGYFFSSESYPDQTNIPTYSNTLQTFDLRNCIDFRRKLSEIRANGYDIILPNSNFVCRFDYYVGRTDTIYIDTEGNFKIASGAPAASPIAPELPENTMPIANLYIKPFTIDSNEVEIETLTINRYTFEEVKKLEERLKNVEYYVGLNALETNALNKNITDITGATLDKKGIFVDNLTTYNNSNIEHPEYFGAIDQHKTTFRGDFKTNHLDLFLDNATMKNGGLAIHSHSITLPYTTKPYVEITKFTHDLSVNPFAVYSWHGQVKLYPESDNWFETRYLPTFYRNIGSPVQRRTFTFYGQWKTYWWGTRSSTKNTSSKYWRWNDGAWEYVQDKQTTYTTTLYQARRVQQVSIIPTVRRYVRDRFVASYAIYFMRARWIRFHATNMRPGIPLKAYFDGQDVSRYCWGLWTNARGEAWGWFYLPPYRFRTGRRLFKLIDAIDGEDSSSAETYYTAQGTLIYRRKTITTIYGSYIQRNSWWQYRTQSYQSVVNWTNVIYRDPLAQSFLVNTPNKTGIFVKAIDLFFSAKDATLPVTIYIAEMENGIPTQRIVPGSEVSLNPSQVNASSPSYGTMPQATTFTFDEPVYLQEGKEYAVVVFSNSNKYRLWVGTIGERDIVSGRGVYKNPYAGVMFKSQNSSTWTPEQNSDIAMRIHQCVFDTTAPKTLTFANDLYEIHYNAHDNAGNDLRIDVSEGEHLITTDGTAEAFVVAHSNETLDIVGSGVAEQFKEGEIITGGTSGAKAVVVRASTGKPRLYITRDGAGTNNIPFQTGETITGSQTGFTAILASNDYYVILVHGKIGTFTGKTLQTYNTTITNETYAYNAIDAISANISVDYIDFPQTGTSLSLVVGGTPFQIDNKEDVDFGNVYTIDQTNTVQANITIQSNDPNVSPIVHKTRASALFIDNNTKKFIYLPENVAATIEKGNKISQTTAGGQVAYGYVENIDHYYGKDAAGNDYARVILHDANNVAFDASPITIGGTTTNLIPVYVGTTNQYEGYLYGTYISKTVNLEQDATELRAYINANIQASTDIEVYYTNENITALKKIVVNNSTTTLLDRNPAWAQPNNPMYMANKQIVGTQSHVYNVAATATANVYAITDLNCVVVPTRLDASEVFVQNVSNEAAFAAGNPNANVVLVSSIPIDVATAQIYDWNINGVGGGGTAFPVGSYVIYNGMIWKVLAANNVGVIPSTLNQAVYKLIPSFFATDSLVKGNATDWKPMSTTTTPTTTGNIEYEFVPKEAIVDKFKTFGIKINIIGQYKHLVPEFSDVRVIAAG